jgi:alpha-methylacyl-CoA racemase
MAEGRDVCLAPILSMSEALDHPHNAIRETFISVAGVTQPGPAPRLSSSPVREPRPGPRTTGQHTDEILREAGHDPDALRRLREGGVVQ